MNTLDLITNYQFLYQNENYFYLYRHQSFAEYSIKGLEESTLYFSSPQKFNDPFDSCFSLKEQPNKDFHNTILSNLEIKGNPAQKILNRKKSQFLLEQSFLEGSFFEEHFKKIGVICLNHNPLNILMWSHYADNHRGFLLEFRFPKTMGNLKKLYHLPFPVTYQYAFPSGKLNSFQELDIYTMFYTKANDWSYEKEFRILATGFESINDKFRSYHYPEDWLSSVILGCCTDDPDGEKVRGILKRKNSEVPIYQAKKILNSFGLTVPNHPRLDVLTKSKKRK